MSGDRTSALLQGTLAGWYVVSLGADISSKEINLSCILWIFRLISKWHSNEYCSVYIKTPVRDNSDTSNGSAVCCVINSEKDWMSTDLLGKNVYFPETRCSDIYVDIYVYI